MLHPAIALPTASRGGRILPFSAGTALAAALLVLVTQGFRTQVSELPNAADRQILADFTLPTLDGRHWTLSAQRGRVILVNVFGVSVAPAGRKSPVS